MENQEKIDDAIWWRNSVQEHSRGTHILGNCVKLGGRRELESQRVLGSHRSHGQRVDLWITRIAGTLYVFIGDRRRVVPRSSEAGCLLDGQILRIDRYPLAAGSLGGGSGTSADPACHPPSPRKRANSAA